MCNHRSKEQSDLQVFDSSIEAHIAARAVSLGPSHISTDEEAKRTWRSVGPFYPHTQEENTHS